MNTINYTQAAQSASLNRFTPSQKDQNSEAADNFAQFYCYRLAKTFTETFETDNFEQEMAYSTFLPEALGTILAESDVGQTLKENVTEILDKPQKNTPPSSEAFIPTQQSMHSGNQEFVPDEMLETKKWIS